jgi:hypothetical protein
MSEIAMLAMGWKNLAFVERSPPMWWSSRKILGSTNSTSARMDDLKDHIEEQRQTIVEIAEIICVPNQFLSAYDIA